MITEEIRECGAGRGWMHGYSCPYYRMQDDVCTVSLSQLVVDRHRKRHYCAAEDYDNCPLLLAKLLRSR